MINRKSRIFNYLVALLTTIFAALLKSFLIQKIHWPEGSFVLSTGSIMVSAWYGGLGPGILATFLNYLILDFFFIGPHYLILRNTASQNLGISIFVSEGILISLLCESLHKTRRKMENAMLKLTQSEQFFRSLTENVKDYAIFMVNTTGQILSWNEGAEAILKIQSSKILGKNFYHIFYNFRKDSAKKFLQIARQKGKYENEGWKKRLDESIFWANITVTHLEDKSSTPIGYSIIVKDLTDRKKLEDTKSQFLSIIAHELQTPISISRLIIETLLKKYRQQRVDSYNIYNINEELNDLDSEFNRLTILINDLLDFSKTEVKKLKLNSQEVDLITLVKQVVYKMNKISDKHLVTFKPIPKSPIQLYIDPIRIEQVLINLIDNSIRHSSPNSLIPSKINVRIQNSGSEIIIKVKDQGQGIPSNQIKNIFDKYYQINGQNYRGFGLGLYISKMIIELHQGKIKVESEVERGSTFSIFLPKVSQTTS